MIPRFADLERAREIVASRGGEIGRVMTLLDETSSTNDEAKRGAKEGAPHGAVWIAESQRAGRGRQGREWVSKRGENLLFSVLLRVDCPVARLPELALVAGLSVRDAVAIACPRARVKIKWPNDVVVEKKKIAGILVESTLTGSRVDAVVVGIGINVHTRDFPDDLGDRATSIALESGSDHPPDRAVVLADTLAALDRDASLAVARGLGVVHARLAAADALSGSAVKTAEIEGVAEGIDLEGRLLVRKKDGVLARIGAGEVHLSLR